MHTQNGPDWIEQCFTTVYRARVVVLRPCQQSIGYMGDGQGDVAPKP